MSWSCLYIFHEILHFMLQDNFFHTQTFLIFSPLIIHFWIIASLFILFLAANGMNLINYIKNETIQIYSHSPQKKGEAVTHRLLNSFKRIARSFNKYKKKCKNAPFKNVSVRTVYCNILFHHYKATKIYTILSHHYYYYILMTWQREQR